MSVVLEGQTGGRWVKKPPVGRRIPPRRRKTGVSALQAENNRSRTRRVILGRMDVVRWRWPLWAAALAGLSSWGCAGQGLVDDGTSVSFGPPNSGTIINPARLPDRGDGYVVPETWARRGLRYGSDELVGMVVYLGRDLEARDLGRPLVVADLSPERGGPSAWHRSHQTGRDVDLLFYVRDAAGQPVVPTAMHHYGGDGASVAESRDPDAAVAPLYFDDHANWMLVRALITNPIADVEYVFISEDLKQRLLDQAVALGEPRSLVEAASFLLHQPSHAPPHDDHMHVRILCPPSDVAQGCREMGPLWWYKKDYKYRPERLAHSAMDQRIGAALRSRQVIMAALPSLPFRGFVPR